jgi:hypothetical protein
MVDGMENFSLDPDSEFAGVSQAWWGTLARSLDQLRLFAQFKPLFRIAVQSELKCCGVNGYKDWGNTTYGNQRNGVPDACCVVEVQDCGADMLLPNADIRDINTVRIDVCIFDSTQS